MKIFAYKKAEWASNLQITSKSVSDFNVWQVKNNEKNFCHNNESEEKVCQDNKNETNNQSHKNNEDTIRKRTFVW